MRNRFLAKLMDSFWDYVSDAALRHIVAILGLLAPAVSLLLRNGLSYFTRPASVPGWLLAVGTGALLATLLWCLLTTLRTRARRQKKFMWRGLEWVLRESFWLNYEHFRPDEVTIGFVGDCLRGPFCATCKKGVAVRLEGQEEPCPYCGAPFDWKGLKLVGEIFKRLQPTEAARMAAFVDAQGEARAHRL